jgi:hypothetical protein
LQPLLEVEVDRVHLAQPAPRGRRLLVRLVLFAFCGGLLLLLSSRPADAAERQGLGLPDPVGATSKATTRVDDLARRATGSGTSSVAAAADAVRRTVAPPSRPAASAVRATAAPAAKRGAPAVTSPVRRVAPPTSQVTRAVRTVTRPLGGAAEPATRTARGTLDRAPGPASRAAEAASRALGRVAPVVDRVAGLTAPALHPLGPALAPVGSALAPVGSALAPITRPAGGIVRPLVPAGLLPLPGRLPLALPGRTGGTKAPAGPVALLTGLEGTGSAGRFLSGPAVSDPTPARPAAGGAGSPAARPFRFWPALTGAVSLPGVPASAELPAGGPDPLSTSSGAGLGLAALAAVLLLLGPVVRGRARPERSGILSRSYLPLVSPA